MNNIVIGYDGSEAAKRALAKTAALASTGAAVSVVSAAGVHGGAVHGALPIDSDEVTERRSELDEARTFLAEKGISCRLVEGRGDPADVIVDEAKQTGADLIVVGTRGQNPVARTMLGSVSTRVVQEAPCDVLVVR